MHSASQLACFRRNTNACFTTRRLVSAFLHQYLCLRVNSVMANCSALPVYSFTCISLPPSHLCLFVLIYDFPVLYLSDHFFYLHLCLYCTLSSSPLPSLLPLFRLCKVQLGFGAFGLQAWQQEDALSEYALLGSLCVTLYYFALLFTCCPDLCCTFLLLLYILFVNSWSAYLSAGLRF